ncbi:MAG: hypothetical protein RSG53_08860 [Oscillospiraceae bacterium]
MNVASRIKFALSQFGDPVFGGTKESVTDLPDTGKYYTFTIITLGADFADNKPQVERYLVTINFFCPLNFKFEARRRATKQVLFDADFTWPSTTDASDADGRHIVFECETIEGVDVDG